MIGGEFDLSSGVIVGTTGMFTALFSVHAGWNVVVSMLVSLLIAVAIGVLNGVMVVKSRLPSFIVTLGAFFALQGFNLWLTSGSPTQTQVVGIETPTATRSPASCSPPTSFTSAASGSRW